MSTDQVGLIQMWTNVALAATSTASLIALIMYVVKTWHIATQTARSAAATEAAARATEASARTSENVLAEMKEARFAESAPYLVAYFDIPYGDFLVYLVVKNIGRSAARDVRISLVPPLDMGRSGENLRPLPQFLTEPVPFFPASFEFRTILFSANEVFSPDYSGPSKYRATLSYCDARTGTAQSEDYLVDFSSFRNTQYSAPTTLKHVRESIEKIAKHQEKLASSAHAIEDVLKDGVRLTNDALLVEVAATPDAPEDRVTAKLAQVVRAWQVWRDADENQRYGAVDELRSRLRLLRNQLVYLTSNREAQPFADRVAATVGTLDRLLSHRFYIDGGQSFRRFDAIGDELLDAPASTRTIAVAPDEVSDLPLPASSPESDSDREMAQRKVQTG